MARVSTGAGSRGGYLPPPNSDRHEVHLLDLMPKHRTVPDHQQQRLLGLNAGPSERGPLLYCAGRLDLLQKPAVAVVGTRAVTPEGAARARRFARELVAAKVVVVSGLAKGVDGEALRSAISEGGEVVAVIGTPLDKAYPAENKRLQESIYGDHLLISPFADGTVVQKHFFPQRNRVMAAVTDATVIIEASDTSGTLHQATECARLGRWLFIAKSVLDDTRLAWPAKFKEYARMKTLTRTEDVLDALVW